MAKHSVRVSFRSPSGDGPVDFQSGAVVGGSPMLDPGEANSRTLAGWFGDAVVARPELDFGANGQEIVGARFFPAGRDGIRLEQRVEPMTSDDLDRHPIYAELFTEFGRRLGEARPADEGERELLNRLRVQWRTWTTPDAEASGTDTRLAHWFKYLDPESGRWRALWCWGYLADPHAPGLPTLLCDNPSCATLFLHRGVVEKDRPRCPHCSRGRARAAISSPAEPPAVAPGRSWRQLTPWIVAAALLVAAGIAWSLLPGRDQPGAIDPVPEKVAKSPEPGGVQPGDDPDPETNARMRNRRKTQASGPNSVDPSIQAKGPTKSNESNLGTVANRHDSPTKQQPGDNVEVQDGDDTGNGKAKGSIGGSQAGRDTKKTEDVATNDEAVGRSKARRDTKKTEDVAANDEAAAKSEAGRDTKKTEDVATAARNEAKRNSGMARTDQQTGKTSTRQTDQRTGKMSERQTKDATRSSRKNRASDEARDSNPGGETSKQDDATENGVGASPPPLSDLQITGMEGRRQKDGNYIIPIRVWGKGPAGSRYRLADQKRPDLKVPWTEPRNRPDGTIAMELESPPLPGSDPDDTYPLLLQARLPDGTVLSRPVGAQLDEVIKVKVTEPASAKTP